MAVYKAMQQQTSLTIRIDPIAETDRKPRPLDSELEFGKYTTDHMFLMDYHSNTGWFNPRVVPYQPLALDPISMVLHYNQQVFEGLKAYRLADGGIGLFRPNKNVERLNASARRMVMPELDTGVFLEAITKLVMLDRDWIPSSENTSLYIRPAMLATEPALGVRPSKTYLFFIVMSPVGSYYRHGITPTKIYVSQKHIRAARGGVGDTKTSGNYGPTLFVSDQASRQGYTQVLWLDAAERKYVEEVGTSNVFFLINDELVTPSLSGSILPGVTRDSVIQIAGHWGITVTERQLSIQEVVEGCKSGRVKEAFATGTAAVISPIGQIGYAGQEIIVGSEMDDSIARQLYDELTDIQYGRKEDPYGWRVQIL